MRQHPDPIDVLATEVRDQLDAQVRHFDRLEARAGVALGLAGLFVALSTGAPGHWIAAARGTGFLSALLSLRSFLVRDLPALDVAWLRREYLSADIDATRLTLLDTRIEMLERARKLTAEKAQWLKMTIRALSVGVVLAAVSLLFDNPG